MSKCIDSLVLYLSHKLENGFFIFIYLYIIYFEWQCVPYCLSSKSWTYYICNYYFVFKHYEWVPYYLKIKIFCFILFLLFSLSVVTSVLFPAGVGSSKLQSKSFTKITSIFYYKICPGYRTFISYPSEFTIPFGIAQNMKPYLDLNSC